MAITTVKISTSTKSALDGVRHKNESYDKTIARLLKEKRKENLKKELKEGYIACAEESRKTVKEWEHTSPEW